jgi:hypothetical protein
LNAWAEIVKAVGDLSDVLGFEVIHFDGLSSLVSAINAL